MGLEILERGKGTGFSVPKDGGDDVFVHVATVQKGGHAGLTEGAMVRYELIVARDGKIFADNCASSEA